MAANDKNRMTEQDLARFFADEASPAERKRIENWAAQSEENRDHFLKLKAAWIETGLILPKIEREEASSFDVDAAWTNVRRKKELRTNAPSAHSGITFPQLLRIAAVLVILLGLGWWAIDHYRPEQIIELTAVDEMVSDTLSDGSFVILNEGSTLTAPSIFSETRKVSLTGEAYFKVRHNPDQPFIVSTGEVAVRVLGTSFNINAPAGKDFIIVTVDDGKVLFYGEKDSLALQAGMTGRFNKQSKEFTLTKDLAVSTHNFWRTRALSFNSASLSEVAETLSSVFHSPISLENEELKKCKISVQFEGESLEEMLEIISATLNLRVDTTDQKIILRGDGC